MSNFIQDRINDSSLVLYHDYRAGHALDLSGQGNDGTPASTFWASNGLQFSATGEVTVADAAELQLTAGTLVVLGDFHSQNVESFIYKRDGGGTNYDFGITALNVCLYDGTNTRILAASVIGHKYVAVNMANGDTGEVFIDGISSGNLDAASAISVDNAPLLIGNDHGDASNTDANIYAVLVFNRKLTATEHAQLYSELANLRWPRKASAKAQGSFDSELVTDGDMETAGTAAYTAGNAATLTKEDNRVLGGDRVLRVAHNGTANPYAYQVNLTAGVTYRITGWARGDGTGYPRIVAGAGNPTGRWNGTTATGWQQFDITVSATHTWLLLQNVIAAAGFCEFDNISVRRVADTETQFKTDYAAQISEANVATGQIENTPFCVNSGTWKVTTDTINGETCKVLECVTNGVAYIDATLLSGDPTQDAYGTWRGYINNEDAATLNILIVADVEGGPAAAGQDGYRIKFAGDESIAFYRVTNGAVAVALCVTTASYYAADTWHELRITRRQSDGQFYLYLDEAAIDPTGGSGANPSTDTTHTTSLYMIFDFDAGDKIALADPLGDHCLQKLHGVITP